MLRWTLFGALLLLLLGALLAFDVASAARHSPHAHGNPGTGFHGFGGRGGFAPNGEAYAVVKPASFQGFGHAVSFGATLLLLLAFALFYLVRRRTKVSIQQPLYAEPFVRRDVDPAAWLDEWERKQRHD
jgi:hypothetical protein